MQQMIFCAGYSVLTYPAFSYKTTKTTGAHWVEKPLKQHFNYHEILKVSSESRSDEIPSGLVSLFLAEREWGGFTAGFTS